MASPDLPELFDVVVVQVDGAIFALDAGEVRRVVLLKDPREVQAIPRADPALRGTALVGGAPLLVIDLQEVVASEGAQRSLDNDADETQHGAFPILGILCRVDDESVLLVGGQVRATGRLRAADESAFQWAGIAKRGVEWRGRAVPVLSILHMLTSVSEPSKTRRTHDR